MLLYGTTCGVLPSFPGKQCLGGWAFSATKMDEVIFAGFCTQLLVSLPGSGFCVEWNDHETSTGRKIIRREKISVSSTRYSLRKEDMQIPLDFFIADCSYSTQHTAAGCVPTQPFAPWWALAVKPQNIYSAAIVFVSHTCSRFGLHFQIFLMPLQVPTFGFTEQRSPSSSLNPSCWGPTIFC